MDGSTPLSEQRLTDLSEWVGGYLLKFKLPDLELDSLSMG